MYNGRIFNLITEEDNTIKQFMDRFYVLPKDHSWSKEEREFLELYTLELTDENEKLGKDGYIVMRKKKIFDEEEVAAIKKEVGSYRSLAKKYNVSVGTISKIKNDKY